MVWKPKPTDPKVEALQRALTYAGEPTAITGRMDQATKDNIVAFQRSHGLTPDGIAGPKTWQALQSATAPPVP
jgi:peptidoglycan hydrolase-like protein with peptidoglycan-binding domain